MHGFALAVSSFCPLINLQDSTQRLSILWSLSSRTFDSLVIFNLLNNLSQDFVYKYLQNPIALGLAVLNNPIFFSLIT